MTRLLLHDAALRSVAEPLAARAATAGARLDILSMDDSGVVTCAGEIVETGCAQPDIAWLNATLSSSGAARAFVGELFKAPRLQWVQSAAAGFDHPLFAGLVSRGVKLSTSHVHSEPIADYVLAGVLDHFQRGPDRRADQTNRVWRTPTFREINASRWLIIGFGSIGQAVARRARAFGAEVVGVRRNPVADALADRVVSLEALQTELGRADVVVLCAPLNSRTRHMADARFFSAMTPGAVLVNVGRGALVHEADLLAALDRGVPAHAVLDVFETEPLPPESPFWAHARVSLTAHTASETDAVDVRNATLFLDNLDRYLTGKPLVNLVEPADVVGSS